MASVEACSPGTFNPPSLFGAEILAIDANVVSDYVHPALPDTTLQAFCNVTVTYTHPGQNDKIGVEVWLPIDSYNGRLKAVGGGGWSPGRSAVAWPLMADAILEEFATVTTDAGLVNDGQHIPWALLSPGNVDLFSLQNFASVSLNDEAVIAKAVIKDFYGEGPVYSYWYGCSQGGRQGFMLAQRYPEAYDGIAAYAPAIHYNPTLASIHWPYQVMLNLGVFPDSCEFDSIRAAAISFCDELDGVADGIVTNVDECVAQFNPFSLVNTPTKCGNSTIKGTGKITEAAAIVLNESWHGLRTEEGRRYWYGFNPAADLTGNDPKSGGLWGPIKNDCSNGTCTGVPNWLTSPWFRELVLKRPDADLSQFDHADFDRAVHIGGDYDSIVGTDDPNLSEFRKAGGKLVTAHGLEDPLISHKSTEVYYKAVESLDGGIQDFFRYFEVPGMAHCGGGSSSLPNSLFKQTMSWVENGTAPDSTPVQVALPNGDVHDRILCPYPQRAGLDVCDDPANVECWSCSESEQVDEL